MTTVTENIAIVQKYLKTQNIDACILRDADPHQSEYPSERWKYRRHISGFTGTAGSLLITRDFAGLWVDSRYHIQAGIELKNTPITLYKEGLADVPTMYTVIKEKIPEGGTVLVNAETTSLKDFRKLESELKSKDISPLPTTFPSEFWPNRPKEPGKPINSHEHSESVNTRLQKLDDVREKMKEQAADFLFIPSLEDIAWVLNLRGSDIAFSPLFSAFLIIDKECALLYASPDAISETLENELNQSGIRLLPKSEIQTAFASLSGNKIWIDPDKTPIAIHKQLGTKECFEAPLPTLLMKAVKQEREIEGFRSVMVQDGVALVKFLAWLDQFVGKSTITETQAAAKLLEFRSQNAGFVSESFPAISAYGPNAAIVHYQPGNYSDAEIEAKGFLLLDSGGQYPEATTDITRTIPVGPLTDEEKRDFTLVLKGHLALADAVFPEGTRGIQLDTLARQHLWRENMNYLHGTGHGVGLFLSVHEGPQSISPAVNKTKLKVGMILSNEPGLYKEGKHGIRIENLVAVRNAEKSEFGQFLKFETLSLCPIDTRPVLPQILTKAELHQLEAYNKKVRQLLFPHLSQNEKSYVERITTLQNSSCIYG